MKRQFAFLFFLPLGKIVVFHDSWKDLLFLKFLIFSKSCNYLFVFVIRFSMNITVLLFVRLWWAQVDSNHRPRAYQARALTCWAMSPFDIMRSSVFLIPCSLWWRWGDSDPWPPACRAGALPTELHPLIRVSRKIIPEYWTTSQNLS